MRAAPLHRRPGIIYGLCGKERPVMIRTALSLVIVALSTAPALAQAPAPESEDTRYIFNRVDDGYLRLDGRTGQVSLCVRRTVGWACQAVPDDRTALEAVIARLGADNARKLFLTAEKISAPEMLRIGYLTAMVPMEALDAEVDKLANILGGNAPVAMAGMKRAINEFARGKLDENAADQRHRDSMRSAEIKEGIKAFAEKRPPRF